MEQDKENAHILGEIERQEVEVRLRLDALIELKRLIKAKSENASGDIEPEARAERDETKRKIQETSDAMIKGLTLIGFAGAIFTVGLKAGDTGDNAWSSVALWSSVAAAVVVVALGIFNTFKAAVIGEGVFYSNRWPRFFQFLFGLLTPILVIFTISAGAYMIINDTQNAGNERCTVLCGNTEASIEVPLSENDN